MHDVRRIVDEATDARLVPWIACLAPLPVWKHDVDLLGWVTVVGVLGMRRHEADADADIAPYLEPVRTSDCRVGVAVQELLALCLGAGPDLPVELRLDGRKGVGQSADGAWLAARMLQRRRQMAADRQSSRAGRPAWVDGVRSAVNIRSAAAGIVPLAPEPWRIAASAEVRNRWRSGERSDVISGTYLAGDILAHGSLLVRGFTPDPNQRICRIGARIVLTRRDAA